MKEIRKTKMIEQTEVTFVANDGKEFYAAPGVDENILRQQCEQYERRNDEAAVTKKFEALHPVYLNIPFAKNIFGDECSAFIVNVKTKEDIETIIDRHSLYNTYCEDYVSEKADEILEQGTVLFITGTEWIDCYTRDHWKKEIVEDYKNLCTYFRIDKPPVVHSFIDDKEKMSDFCRLSEEEFLKSYSYLTEDEYNATVNELLKMGK